MCASVWSNKKCFDTVDARDKCEECHCSFHILGLQLLISYLRTFVTFLEVAGFLFLLVVVLTLKNGSMNRISEPDTDKCRYCFSHPAVRQRAMQVLLVTISPCITNHGVGREVHDGKTGGCHVVACRACRTSQMSPRRRFRGISQKSDIKML